ncbi:MAG: VOC family protein, partial [Serratia inhibens]|uniref:VOC family protein n=1 Tax=Serratia inhibens TaxID=2338073 RepID=UPI003C7D52D0
SDSCPQDGADTSHKGFSLSLNPNDVEQGRELFEKLSQGGQVTMPYGPTFWAKGFGMLTDQFGVNWMINVE